jgi:hypothetical protein
MPPHPLYGWACVLHSVAEILTHAAKIRSNQVEATRDGLNRSLGVLNIAQRRDVNTEDSEQLQTTERPLLNKSGTGNHSPVQNTDWDSVTVNDANFLSLPLVNTTERIEDEVLLPSKTMLASAVDKDLMQKEDMGISRPVSIYVSLIVLTH